MKIVATIIAGLKRLKCVVERITICKECDRVGGECDDCFFTRQW